MANVLAANTKRPSTTFGPPALELRVAASRESLCLVREQVEAFLRHQLDARGRALPLDEVLLALQEATTNVVRHAYRDRDEPGDMAVRVELTPLVVRLFVADHGRGYEPSEVPPPSRHRPREGGYGLHLMRSLMSKVSYVRERHENVLMMEKVLQGGSTDGERP